MLTIMHMTNKFCMDPQNFFSPDQSMYAAVPCIHVCVYVCLATDDEIQLTYARSFLLNGQHEALENPTYKYACNRYIHTLNPGISSRCKLPFANLARISSHPYFCLRSCTHKWTTCQWWLGAKFMDKLARILWTRIALRVGFKSFVLDVWCVSVSLFSSRHSLRTCRCQVLSRQCWQAYYYVCFRVVFHMSCCCEIE
jgi:hypothetical protein